MTQLGLFFNTTHLTGDALRAAVAAAEHQDAAVLTIYRNAGGPLSPSQVWALCEQAGKHWPLTSVRRAINTLTKAGALSMTGQKRTGVFGRPEHQWGIAA